MKNLDLITAILLAALNVGWSLIPNHPLIVGILLALPFIFFFPGYTLAQVLFRPRLPYPSTEAARDLILRPGLKLG
jgi:hypothetical protein